METIFPAARRADRYELARARIALTYRWRHG